MKKSNASVIVTKFAIEEFERRLNKANGKLTHDDYELLDAIWRMSHTDGRKYNVDLMLELIYKAHLTEECTAVRPDFADEEARSYGTELIKLITQWANNWSLADMWELSGE